MKIVIGAIVGLLVAGAAAWFLLGDSLTGSPQAEPAPSPEPVATEETIPEPTDIPEPVAEETQPDPNVFGFSVEGRELRFERFGDGEEELMLVGGIHGGYEWNTVILAERFIEYFNENPTAVPDDMTITVIPNLNPDGLHEVVAVQEDGSFTSAMIAENTAPGRFNANTVDLNRNFDCKWQPTAVWREQEVSAGTAAFSEPETAAFRDFVLDAEPALAVFFQSASNGVYGSQCETGILPATITYGELYSEASGYPWIEFFDYYEVTGDSADWLSTVGIPAILVELKTHETIEWEENLAGVTALIAQISGGDSESPDDTDAEDVPSASEPL